MTSVALAPSHPLPRDAADAERMYATHADWLERFCARQLGSTSEAEDALQTTFLYALRALRRGVVPECEEAWLTTIAKNVCRTYRRTQSRRGIACDVELDRIALAAPDHDEALLLSELPAVLRALPQTQRDALVLREWHGLDAQEIGSRLGLTSTATHALLTRARRSFISALTSAVGRPLSAVNAVALVEMIRTQLKALLGGASTKAAVGVAVAGVAAGGAVVTQSLHEPSPPAPVIGREVETRRSRSPQLPILPQSVARPAGQRADARMRDVRRDVEMRVRAADGGESATRPSETEAGEPVVPPGAPDAPSAPERPEAETPVPVDLGPELPPLEVPPLPELPIDGSVPSLPPAPEVPLPTVPEAPLDEVTVLAP